MNKNKEYYNAIWNEIEKPKNNNVIKRKKNRIIEKAIIVICIIYGKRIVLGRCPKRKGILLGCQICWSILLQLFTNVLDCFTPRCHVFQFFI